LWLASRRLVSGVITTTLPTRVRHMAITALSGSMAAYLSALARGITVGVMAAAGAIAVATIVAAMDIAADTVAITDMPVIAAAEATMAVAEAFMVVEAVSTAAAVVASTVVVVMAAAGIGNLPLRNKVAKRLPFGAAVFAFWEC
jgi:hypothetical protein